jgi:hypothetical protein
MEEIVIDKHIRKSELSWEEYQKILKNESYNQNSCSICTKLCSDNSSCSDRYCGLGGTFKYNNSLKNKKIPYTIYVCDKCMGDDDPDDITILFKQSFYKSHINQIICDANKDYINIKKLFFIDHAFRMND